MKYLFTALLSNGQYIEQTPNDESPNCKYKSSYFDIEEAQRQGHKVVMFVLVGDGNSYLVDLRDGHFEINEAKFYLHEHRPGYEYRLIYYRNRKKHFTMGFQEISDETAFNFGWQTTINGENIQKILKIV